MISPILRGLVPGLALVAVAACARGAPDTASALAGSAQAESTDRAAGAAAGAVASVSTAEPRDNGFCAERVAPMTLGGPEWPFEMAEPQWNGWGRHHENSRYHPNPGLSAADVPRLRVKWAFGYEGSGPVSQPTIIGDVVYVAGRQVHALDAETGCIYWAFDPGPTGARTAISVGPFPGGGALSGPRFAAYVGARNGVVHALDARTGERLWTTQVEDHPVVRLTGAPLLRGGRLYVPISSGEEAAAISPNYECCTFRGAVATLDAYTGEILWKTYAIREEPRPFRLNDAGTQMYGPAGAAIWSAPTFDLRRNVIYAATGNSYTQVAEGGSDAVIAIHARTGDILWRQQVTEDDNYVVSCWDRPHPNCPEDLGPDWDFGSSPVLRTLADGRQVLLAGQKSGVLWALDPDADGAVLWRKRLGAGGPLGGIQWGFAADDEVAYVAMADAGTYPGQVGEPRPGLTAVRIATGDVIWHTPAPDPACSWSGRACSNAMSAPVTLIPGAVFAGSLDGRLRAFSSRDGSLLWNFDTAREWTTVNGVPGRGGSLNATGPTVAGGRLFLNSGYGTFGGQPGNVLLAFTLDGR